MEKGIANDLDLTLKLLLKAFVNVSHQLDMIAAAAATAGVAASTGWTWTVADKSLAWKVVIHIVLVISGVLFALTDRMSNANHASAGKDDAH